jgi:hypothetical protein
MVEIVEWAEAVLCIAALYLALLLWLDARNVFRRDRVASGILAVVLVLVVLWRFAFE